MTKMLENAMVLPYADDDPIDEPQEQEESTDVERVENIKAAFEHSVTESILDAIEGMHQGLDRLTLLVRKQGE